MARSRRSRRRRSRCSWRTWLKRYERSHQIGTEIQRKQRGYILDHLALKDLLFFHQLCHFLVDISHLVEFSYQPQILRSNLFSETTNLSSRILRRSGSRIGLRWRSCIEAACVRWARCRPGIGSSSGQVAP